MVSIIIVNYHVGKELLVCIESITNSKNRTPFEIIVVDNDEKKTIRKELQKKFPKIIYVPNENKGFGQGNNAGAKRAKGDYLFFINPDTKLLNNSIDILSNFLINHKKAAIVAPLLYDKNNAPYQLQGVKELTPIRALVVFSFINKLFPKNKIFRDYYLRDWDKKTTKEVDVVPGTAFMIRKNIFDEIGGFDEKFFLYFEEFDLCTRIKELGWKIAILPSAKVYHAWGLSTRQREDIKTIFQKSRFYYFKKNFGFLPALFTETFLRINKYSLLLLLAITAGTFLRVNRIYDIMPFIGDQAWFYLSARDMLQSGQIPLLGIPSSHPWLHQGAWWTYILGLGFFIFSYSPYIGAYISIFIDILAIFLMYKLGSLMFSQRVGIIASLFYSLSPIVIFNARMPYHTSPIPLLTLFYLWSLVEWVKGNSKHFPVIILLLALLYNFEIAAFPLALVFLSILTFGFWKKKKWAKAILNKKTAFYSATAFLIPMLPMLIYDFGHGFPQTFRFLAWIGYRVLVLLGYPPINPEIASPNFIQITYFIGNFYNRLILLPNIFLAITIAILCSGFFYKKLFDQLVTKKYNASFLLLGFTFTVSLIGIIATKTTSEAYLPILFPTAIFILALFFDRLLQIADNHNGHWQTLFCHSRVRGRPHEMGSALVVNPVGINNYHLLLTPFILLLILSISILNAYTVINLEEGHGFSDRLAAARQIVSQAHGNRYNLLGEGIGSKYPSFTMNYEYLTWWLGNGPSKDREKLQFIINEDAKGIHVRSVINKN